MIKLWSMFPLTPFGADRPVPREYRSLSIAAPPGLLGTQPSHIEDGEVYLADNYAFIQDNGRQRTYVLGLQTVQLDFQHLEPPTQGITTEGAGVAETTPAAS